MGSFPICGMDGGLMMRRGIGQAGKCLDWSASTLNGHVVPSRQKNGPRVLHLVFNLPTEWTPFLHGRLNGLLDRWPNKILWTRSVSCSFFNTITVVSCLLCECFRCLRWKLPRQHFSNIKPDAGGRMEWWMGCAQLRSITYSVFSSLPTATYFQW